MSSKFSFSLAKDALKQRKGDGKKKKKRGLPDTSHVDKVTGA